jgi:hypothetical protein
MDFAGNFVIGAGFFEGGDPFGPALVVAAMQDFNGIAGWFFLLGHI